jgi:hypothetical protein
MSEITTGARPQPSTPRSRNQFSNGARTGHPMMPEFRLDPDQVVDLIAYLKTRQLRAGST